MAEVAEGLSGLDLAHGQQHGFGPLAGQLVLAVMADQGHEHGERKVSGDSRACMDVSRSPRASFPRKGDAGFVEREGVVRAISLRRASRQERRLYEDATQD